MSLRFVQTQAVTLLTGLSPSATSMIVTPYPVDIQTGKKLVFADFADGGSLPTCTVDPKIPGFEEIVQFSDIIDNGNNTATFTISARNLIGQSPYTTPGTGKQHGASAVVVFSDNPQIYASFASLVDDQTFSGINTFTLSPIVPDPTTNTQAANKEYVDNLILVGAPNASTSVKGLTKLSTAPVSPTSPIAVGNNDTRVPTQGENDAAAGTYGTPGSANKFVTETDPNIAAIVKLTGDQTIAGIKTFSSIPVLPASDPTTANQAARKAYVDAHWATSSGTADGGKLYYSKMGKLYFNFYYANATAGLVYDDAASKAQIASLLGITIATAFSAHQYSGYFWFYNGGVWNLNTGGNDHTWLGGLLAS